VATVLKTKIVKVGNSQGIRIPRLLPKQAGLGEGVELEVQLGQIVVRGAQTRRSPREGWDEQFAAMAERGDDRLLDPEAAQPSAWDTDEWEW
jgi:antitoxin MazE